MKPELRYLRDAATSLAASWFTLCGFSVAIPIEPTVYDLLVVMPEGIKRVQGQDDDVLQQGRLDSGGRS